MKTNELTRRENVALALKTLFRRYGYQPYQMTQFEEYDLYVNNREFLVDERVITFNESGKLFALKPDVTLSIIKRHTPQKGVKEKVSYNENVYRFSAAAGRYKEILQAGVETLGDLDLYDVAENVLVAAESLSFLGAPFYLALSHLGVLSALLKETGKGEAFCGEAQRLVSEKNAHDLLRLCASSGVEKGMAEKLVFFLSLYGERKTVLEKLAPLCSSGEARAALEECRALSGLIDASPFSDRVVFDFSVVNHLRYYSGVVFKGYTLGVSDSVLSGGCYDALMQKSGKNSRGMGFAVYLDLLEDSSPSPTDADVLLLYDEAVPLSAVQEKVLSLQKEGKSVSAQRAVPKGVRFGETVDLRKEPLC